MRHSISRGFSIDKGFLLKSSNQIMKIEDKNKVLFQVDMQHKKPWRIFSETIGTFSEKGLKHADDLCFWKKFECCMALEAF